MSHRLYQTRCTVFGSAPDGMDRPSATVRFVLDLDAAIGVRDVYHFDDSPMPEEAMTMVDLRNGDTFRLVDSFERVVTAWAAYRQQADGLTRLRN